VRTSLSLTLRWCLCPRFWTSSASFHPFAPSPAMRACPLTIKLSERRRGMRQTPRRAQSTLEWTNVVQWDE